MKPRTCETEIATWVDPAKLARRLRREVRWLWAINHGRGDNDLAKKE
jgi:hypothetical protein